jgi:hypothetical protein
MEWEMDWRSSICARPVDGGQSRSCLKPPLVEPERDATAPLSVHAIELSQQWGSHSVGFSRDTRKTLEMGRLPSIVQSNSVFKALKSTPMSY